ncbi:hypothetical protein CERSUDRAFT_116802 [Gelatoporia subvermispora B]|uniref:Cupin 2 conserved barrel domain-containing protein n=1 Tax=Ceriporiopsis subvermispora (strain B) TaxID=914234 RepID=M2QC91_CERS8|nr:hypothetical protein CERSUDRAFT_116802 [Gelatoporia subvermispora B]
MSLPACLIRTSDLDLDSLSRQVHVMVPSNERYQMRIGHQTGLTKTGVHFCRLPPHTTSTTLHWHSHEDEWFYIIEAGDNAVLLLREGGRNDEEEAAATTKEVPIRKGDFLGFAGGQRTAHALRSDDTEIVYLMGGSREALDVTHYPEIGKRKVTDQTGKGMVWAVEDRNVTTISK